MMGRTEALKRIRDLHGRIRQRNRERPSEHHLHHPDVEKHKNELARIVVQVAPEDREVVLAAARSAAAEAPSVHSAPLPLPKT